MHKHMDWLNENYGVGFREMKKETLKDPVDGSVHKLSKPAPGT